MEIITGNNEMKKKVNKFIVSNPLLLKKMEKYGFDITENKTLDREKPTFYLDEYKGKYAMYEYIREDIHVNINIVNGIYSYDARWLPICIKIDGHIIGTIYPNKLCALNLDIYNFNNIPELAWLMIYMMDICMSNRSMDMQIINHIIEKNFYGYDVILKRKSLGENDGSIDALKTELSQEYKMKISNMEKIYKAKVKTLENEIKNMENTINEKIISIISAFLRLPYPVKIINGKLCHEVNINPKYIKYNNNLYKINDDNKLCFVKYLHFDFVRMRWRAIINYSGSNHPNVELEGGDICLGTLKDNFIEASMIDRIKMLPQIVEMLDIINTDSAYRTLYSTNTILKFERVEQKVWKNE